ncbi:MAG: DUF2171 domain-containing protein [Elainella sp. Prado103]|jgi:hypothetical protein|nr:DUF2171 domain-containing protein [Elainella sp. Prado103]
MDISQIKPHLRVHAEGEGGMDGVTGTHIGTVDQVDRGGYIKLTKSDSEDKQPHWFPIDWVKSVDEQAVYLNKTVEAVKSGLMQELPTADGQAQPSNDWVSGAGVD